MPKKDAFPSAAIHPDDPWVHRSLHMKCRTCMWSVEKLAEKPTDVGRCCKHAPTMNGYPVIFMNDWCGDHKLDKTKV